MGHSAQFGARAEIVSPPPESIQNGKRLVALRRVQRMICECNRSDEEKKMRDSVIYTRRRQVEWQTANTFGDILTSERRHIWGERLRVHVQWKK